MKNKRIWVGLVLSLLVMGYVSTQFLKPKIIKTASEVIFKTIKGKHINLKTLLGKPVLITFWATNCPSCIQEIPHLISLYQQFHPQGLEIFAVTMAYNPPNLVVEMARAKQLPYHVVLDLRSDLATAFGDVTLIPRTFLISPDGKIVLNQLGLFDMESMKKLIKNNLPG